MSSEESSNHMPNTVTDFIDKANMRQSPEIHLDHIDQTPKLLPEQLHSKHLWPKLLSEFFKKMNLTQTQKTFDTELLVIPNQFYDSAEIYLSELLGDFQKLISSDAPKSRQPSELNVPSDFKSELRSEKQAFSSTRRELDQDINKFIKQKKARNTQTNLREFIEIKDPKVPTCARSNPKDLNLGLHIKTSVAYNREGPLVRSLGSNQDDSKPSHQLAGTWSLKEIDSTASNQVNIIERLENVEKHLHLIYRMFFLLVETKDVLANTSSANWKPIDRIRAVEAKIMKLERLLPTWAAKHFNQPNRKSPHPPPNYPVKDSRGRIFLESSPRPG